MTAFRVFWLTMLVAGVAGELLALTNSLRADTLSERVWWLVGLPYLGALIRCLLGAFMVWLLVHFVLYGLVNWYGRELVICLALGLSVWIVWTAAALMYGS